jgi:hypothetical protein
MTGRPKRLATGALWILSLTAFCHAPAPLVGEESRPRCLSTLRAAHPRLLFTRDDERRVRKLAETEELLARLIEQNRLNALAVLDEAPVRHEIPDGKRLLAQSRRAIERVLALAMAYRLSGDRSFLDGAAREMLTASGFPDWNPSHFLDTAEMTTALALGYDWLFEAMEPAVRKTIREAIVRLGLSEGLKIYRAKRWWVAGENNWNQVGNGGMVLGALAVAEDEEDLAEEILEHAIASIPAGVRVYAPSGAYPEGPGYWQYGTEYTCLTMSGLTTALGRDFDLHKTPGLERTGDFHIHTIGPRGECFNYADCGVAAPPCAAMFLLSRTYGNAVWARWQRRRLEHRIPASPLRRSREERFFPLEIAWYDEAGGAAAAEELPLDIAFDSRQDIVTMRSRWDDPGAMYVGVKAGDNRTNHGHLDVGSFILDAGGVRWAVDLGADNYNLPDYFGPRRWQYHRLTNRSHNTLVVNDRLQDPNARCEVIDFQSSPERASAVIDMSDAYEGQAVRALRRVELLDRKAVHIFDELTGVDGEVRWGIVTAAKVEIRGGRAVLHEDGKMLEARILEPAEAEFRTVSTAPPTAAENQNSGTALLAIEVRPERGGTVRLRVLLQLSGTGELSVRPADSMPARASGDN